MSDSQAGALPLRYAPAPSIVTAKSRNLTLSPIGHCVESEFCPWLQKAPRGQNDTPQAALPRVAI